MQAGLTASLLVILSASLCYAQELNTTYNPFTGNFDYYSSGEAFEYRAEYDVSDNRIYEGWAYVVSGWASAGDEVWRIAKSEYSGTNLTRRFFAGAGEFLYEWDLRTTYFPTDVSGFLLMSDGTSFILLSDGTSKILIRP